MNPALAEFYLKQRLLQIKTIETDLFTAIEEYKTSPSSKFKKKVRVLQDIYCRFSL